MTTTGWATWPFFPIVPVFRVTTLVHLVVVDLVANLALAAITGSATAQMAVYIDSLRLMDAISGDDITRIPLDHAFFARASGIPTE